MDIDQQTAAVLGFRKLKYVMVERERRWLCHSVPRERILRTEEITDLYVTGTQMRLRQALPANGSAAMLRLTRKADVDAQTRLITSIYLPEDEFAVLAGLLPGKRIIKRRHRLQQTGVVEMVVDEFQGALHGLVTAEAEFTTAEALAAFPDPDFSIRDITADLRFTGGYLAKYGLPKDGWRDT